MAKRFSLPPMEDTVLENGLRLVLIPEHEQDGFVVALQIPVGRFADPVGMEGCAELCVGLLQKGTATYASEQFTEQFEHHGASLFADVGEEHIMIGVKMLSRYKDTLLPLFWEMIVAPRFDEKEFSRLKQEMATALRAETVDPGTIANRHFYHELASSVNHPAGRHHSIYSIKKVTPANIASFYKANIHSQGSVLVVAGDFTTDWFTKSFLAPVAGWRTGTERILPDAPAIVQRERAVRFIEKNDLTQVALVIGQSAPGELNPNRNNIALANYVFGAGNFSSRLMTRIRSSVGSTYSIVSHITAEQYFGALTIATSTRNARMREVLTAILDEYTRFCNQGITAGELATVKRFTIGNMAFQLEGLSNIVEKVLWLCFYHRSKEYLESFDEMIETVSLDAVNRAVAESFNPEKLIIVAVGRRSEVLAPLETFGKPKVYHFKDSI